MRNGIPPQSQLLLPLLEELRDRGGCARPGELYDRIAERLGISADARTMTQHAKNGKPINLYERQIRWTRQTAVCKELIAGPERGLWELTDKARTSLRNARRGTIVTVFETERGVALWACAEDAVGVIDRESVDLLLVSPPYPILRPREYGAIDERTWLDTMLRLCERWRALLTPTGSMVLNVGTTWRSGMPAVSTYIHRFVVDMHDELGLHLCQDLYWYSPSKLPTPLEWLGVRRVRLKSSVEQLLWFSADPANTKADNRRVLVPYSPSGRRSMREERDGKRPSGISFGPNSFARDNGGSIAPNLVIAANAASNDAYHRALRAASEKAHPATMPMAVAEFAIAFLTERDDLVYDPMAGSLTTAKAAEKLERRWIASERSLTYLRGGARRFPDARILA